jgi:hypothetical protein
VKGKCAPRVALCGDVCTFSVLECLSKIGKFQTLPCALSTPEALEVQFSRYTNGSIMF